jgi:DNA-binding NarL/FixJ family response regulator
LRLHRAERDHELRAFRELTAREGEVLGELMRGKSADTIAEESVVSVATIRTQIRSILSKLSVNSQLAAVARAQQARWDPPQSAR